MRTGFACTFHRYEYGGNPHEDFELYPLNPSYQLVRSGVGVILTSPSS
jgi:hypothetical protein